MNIHRSHRLTMFDHLLKPGYGRWNRFTRSLPSPLVIWMTTAPSWQWWISGRSERIAARLHTVVWSKYQDPQHHYFWTFEIKHWSIQFGVHFDPYPEIPYCMIVMTDLELLKWLSQNWLMGEFAGNSASKTLTNMFVPADRKPCS